MKQLIALVLFAGISVFNGKANAQTQKIAFIDLSLVIDTIPQKDTILAKIETLKNYYRDLLTEQENKMALAEKNHNAEKAKPNASQTMLDLYINQYQKANQEYQNISQEANARITDESNNLQAPVFEYIKKVATDIAKERGYTQLMNVSGGALLFNGQPGSDITDAVIKKILAASKPAATPTVPAPGNTTPGTGK